MVASEDVQATYCATLVDSWVTAGVRHAVVAPGSRSTPMALAIVARQELSVHVVHDERVAAFVALGLGLEGVPALLLCTSGTAAANFFPAVVEAGLSDVPMLVLTADRPARLRGVGAPQTIDQLELYGGHVTWFHDAAVASALDVAGWRRLAATAWAHAGRGPVQLNLQFDEPLVGTPLADLHPSGVSGGRADDAERAAQPGQHQPREQAGTARVPAAPNGGLAGLGLDRQRGVILVGGRSGVAPSAIVELQRRTAWPVLADPTSGVRHLDELSEAMIAAFDPILRHRGFADAHAPQTVVRIGRPAASKVLAQWVARATGRTQDPAALVQVGGPGRIDPDANVTVAATIDDMLDLGLHGATGTTWLARWQRAEARAEAALADALCGQDALLLAAEPAVARSVGDASADVRDRGETDIGVVVASSMPVRDLEWFGGRRANAHANRGANGIDGVISTAIGRALTGAPQFVLVGDIAFVHDAGALTALRHRSVDVRIVVIDNDGGGIFSFLPQATELDRDRFDTLFGTPHGTDVVALAAAHGLLARTIDDLADLREQLQRPGPWVVRVASDRGANVDAHRRLNDAVAAAL